MRGPRQPTDRGARRFRSNLPAKRVHPSVAGVLNDAVTIAKAEVDTIRELQRREGQLKPGDINRLATLVDILDRAQRTEARVEAELREQLGDKDDAELAALADGADEEEGA